MSAIGLHHIVLRGINRQHIIKKSNFRE